MNSNQDSGIATPICVLTANFRGMVAETIHQTLRYEPDIHIVGSVQTWKEITAQIAEVDVLVLAVEDGSAPPEAYFRLLEHSPNLKLLMLTITSDDAIAYWRVLHCHPIPMTSSQQLIESIRQLYLLSSGTSLEKR